MQGTSTKEQLRRFSPDRAVKSLLSSQQKKALPWHHFARTLSFQSCSLHNWYVNIVVKSLFTYVFIYFLYFYLYILSKDPQEQLEEKIAELLVNYSIDNPEDFAKQLAKSLTTGTPELRSLLDGEVTDDELTELITQLQGLLVLLNISPAASPATIEAFHKFMLPNQLDLSDFHKVEGCALQKSSILQMVGTICDTFPDPKQLFSILFYLIKRGQGLSTLATTLKEQFIRRNMNNSEYPLRFFVNVLLLNCIPFLRQKLIALLAASNPVPLNEYKLDNGTLSLALIPEPYWVMDDKFVLLSYGLDSCKGKSSILNEIFGITFEQSNGTHCFQGTVDMQFDTMFIKHRNITVTDSHGILSKSHKHALLNLADGVIIHVSEQLWKDRIQLWKDRIQLCTEIDSLTVYNLKFILVLVRDVAAFAKSMNNAAFESHEHISSLKVHGKYK